MGKNGEKWDIGMGENGILGWEGRETDLQSLGWAPAAPDFFPPHSSGDIGIGVFLIPISRISPSPGSHGNDPGFSLMNFSLVFFLSLFCTLCLLPGHQRHLHQVSHSQKNPSRELLQNFGILGVILGILGGGGIRLGRRLWSS